MASAVPNYSATSTSYPSPHQSTNARTKILLLGLRRAGKTSIQQVLFNNLPSNQTFYLETTMRTQKHLVDSVIPLEIWDCPANTTVESLGAPLSQFSTIIFVIDIRDLYNQPISKLVEFIVASYAQNPDIILEVFVHKAEKLQEDDKIENFRQIHERVSDRLLDMSPEYEQMQINFHLTSVYDHSLHEAFSKVLHKLIESLPYLEELLNVFCANSQASKAFLFDTRSRLYVATDASPVDSATHNLCCDYLQMLNSFGPLYRSITATPARRSQLTGESPSDSLSIPNTPPPSSSSSSLSPHTSSSSSSSSSSSGSNIQTQTRPTPTAASSNHYLSPPPTNGNSNLLSPTPSTPSTPRAQSSNPQTQQRNATPLGLPGSSTSAHTVTPTLHGHGHAHAHAQRSRVHGGSPQEQTQTHPTTPSPPHETPEPRPAKQKKNLFYPSASTTLASPSSSSSNLPPPAAAYPSRGGGGGGGVRGHRSSSSSTPNTRSPHYRSTNNGLNPDDPGPSVNVNGSKPPINGSGSGTGTALGSSSSAGTTTLTYHLVTRNLALLAFIPTNVFLERRGLVEYNVVFFREGVQEICDLEEEARG